MKKYLRFLLFSVSSIILFLGGVFFTQYPYHVIPPVIIALTFLFLDYLKTSKEISNKIEGEGIRKIIVSNKEASGGKTGDLWMKYKD